jgi:hypothetical protein
MWQMVANGLWEIFVVPGPSMGGSRTACPRCNAQMVEMVRTEPSENEPGFDLV